MNLKHAVRHLVRPKHAIMTANGLATKYWEEKDYNTNGVKVMSEDWDILIILDACPYQIFKRYHPFPGELESKASRGAATVEFLRGNFRDATHHDTVYVSANPQISRLKNKLNCEFYDLINVWETGWDPSIQNVHPETMVDVAQEAIKNYPNKRLIFHFNQPHGPFLGQTAEDSVIGPNRVNNESLLDFAIYEAKHGLVSSEVWEAGVKETFQIACEHVMDLLQNLEGKIVITSDHGEMTGERGSPIPVKYNGHPIGARNQKAIKIPWLVYETGDRKKIVAEEPQEHSTNESNDIKKRLRDLGYVG